MNDVVDAIDRVIARLTESNPHGISIIAVARGQAHEYHEKPASGTTTLPRESVKCAMMALLRAICEHEWEPNGELRYCPHCHSLDPESRKALAARVRDQAAAHDLGGAGDGQEEPPAGDERE